MSSQPPASLDALIDSAADAMEIELSNTPDTPAPESAPPPVTPAVPSAPEPPAPPVQAQTPPTPTVAQAEQATPAVPTADPFEAIRAELAETKAALAALKAPPAPVVPETPAEPPPTPQELVELDTIINGFSQSYWQADAQHKQADANRNQWASHLRGLNKQLVRSYNDPAIDTGKLISEITAAEEAVSQYDRFLEMKAQERSSYFRDFKTYETLRASTDKILKLTASQERANQVDETRKLESEAANWRTAKWEPAKKAVEAKIPENLRGRFDAYVERLGKAHVHSRGEDGRFTNSISDPNAFVAGLVDDFLAVAREGAQSYTAQKTAEIPASPANGKAGTPVAPSSNGKPKTEAEFDAHMDELWANA